ncbi:MarR family transcriptional regulator [Halovivax cerinus]|uniref:MarR family transcriptional regulator n=1 Tax=Halovivax cerinus TaxID=1487865 RepID=A0ABD5NP35_9EURY|nr:helix-turn-helix domain-containing protein [Halovivax cerinus]
MSIDRETFERSEAGELTDVSTTEQVLGFLAANEDRAFKASEIAARAELDVGSVSTALTRLKRRNLVEHKGTYWAITSDEDRLARSDGYERATALFNEQLGPEDRTEWRAHAPDEPHPSLEEADRDR